MILSKTPQGTDEWLQERYAKVTGTTAKQLYGNMETIHRDLLVQFTEAFELEETFDTDAMARGRALEPEARKWLSTYIGEELLEVGFALNDALPLLGMSFDGLTIDNKIACEIKCLGGKAHMDICLSNEIPLDHLKQCIHAFTVNSELESLYFLAYRPEALKKQVVIELKRDSIVNVGTNAKPKLITINEAVEFCVKQAEELNKRIYKSIQQLSF